MIEDIAILVENKSKIIDYTIDYIKRTDSWRLKKDKHVKCRRDLAYIIDAFQFWHSSSGCKERSKIIPELLLLTVNPSS